MSRIITTIGGIPKKFPPDPNALGCCSNRVLYTLDDKDEISNINIVSSNGLNFEQCLSQKKEFKEFLDKKVKFKVIDGRKVITNISDSVDSFYYKEFLNAVINNDKLPFVIFNWKDADCDKLRGTCCYHEDIIPFVDDPCFLSNQPECWQVVNPLTQLSAAYWTHDGQIFGECEENCITYGIFCDKDSKQCVVFDNRDFHKNFYKDKQGNLKPVASQDYSTSSDNNIYFSRSEAQYICDQSIKWICLTPQMDPSLLVSKCIKASTLCYDLPQDQQVYDSEAECLLNCDCKGALTILDNMGCKFINCIKNITGSEALEIIEQMLNDRLEDASNTKYIFRFDPNNNCFEKITKKSGDICDDCSLCDNNGECVEAPALAELGDCYECSSESPKQYYKRLGRPAPKNILFIVNSKCKNWGENYDAQSDTCIPLECNECQKIVQESFSPELNIKSINNVTIGIRCVTYKCENICESNEKCCDGECVPIDQECATITPTPPIETTSTPTPTPAPGFPITVTLSDFSGLAENCNCYNGTYVINEPDTEYSTSVCPPNEYALEASVSYQYVSYANQVRMTMHLVTPDGSFEHFTWWSVDFNTGNYAVEFASAGSSWCTGNTDINLNI